MHFSGGEINVVAVCIAMLIPIGGLLFGRKGPVPDDIGPGEDTY